MPPSSNKRRPRSGAPDRPDLQEEAERRRAEIFGNEPETPEPTLNRATWVRSLSGLIVAALFYAGSLLLNNQYMLIFALSLAITSLTIIVVRLISARRK